MPKQDYNGYREPTQEERVAIAERGGCQVIRTYPEENGTTTEKICPNDAKKDGLCEYHLAQLNRQGSEGRTVRRIKAQETGTEPGDSETKESESESETESETNGEAKKAKPKKKEKKVMAKSNAVKKEEVEKQPRGGKCDVCQVEKETTRNARDGRRICEYCSRLERLGKSRRELKAVKDEPKKNGNGNGKATKKATKKAGKKVAKKK